jgi:hypothetical protein
VNPARNGVVVDGDRVNLYGLFVEHFQERQVVWNGEEGHTWFYQSELPYDAPSQEAWRAGANGWPSYVVSEGVAAHEAWGLGIYAVFTERPGMILDRAIEMPRAPGVAVHHAVTLSITDKGSIAHVVNDAGGEAAPADFATYPRLAAWP